MGNMFCFEPITSVNDDPVLRLIDNLKEPNTVAIAIDWMSWLWQKDRFGILVDPMQPGIRAFAIGQPESFAAVGCRAAWWSLSKSDIELYAEYL